MVSIISHWSLKAWNILAVNQSGGIIIRLAI